MMSFFSVRGIAAVLPLVLLLSACSTPSKPAQSSVPSLPAPAAPAACDQRAPDEQVVGEWYAANALPLKSLTPGAGFADLQPLKKALANVRVMGLGEGTHGTHEFMTVRHRLFQFLAKEMGFRVIAVEASYSAALKIDAYVQTGEGDPKALVQGLLSWPFTTAEMLDLINWMRTYNKTVAPDQRLHYAAFDVLRGEELSTRLESFLAKVDPQYLEENRSFVRHIATQELMPRAVQSQELRDQELARMQSIRDHLIANERNYAALSSPAEASAAILHARNLVGTYDSYVATTEVMESARRRDRYMAEMIQGLLGQFGPDTRMALIAHNGHVVTEPNMMGSYLRQLLDKEYYATELLFGQGSFRALDSAYKFQNFSVGTAPADYLEFQLICANLGDAFVDYRLPPRSGAVQRWLEAPHQQRHIGGLYDPNQTQGTTGGVSPLKWDGLIYIVNTTPTTPA